MINETIKTFDRDGKCFNFLCKQKFSDSEDELNFNITTIEAHPRGEFFQFTIKKIGNQIYKIIMMSHNYDKEYIGKGIAECLIPFLMKKLSIKIVSSTNIDLPGEFRSEEANKFWGRMVKMDKARYDSLNKRYAFISEEEK